MLGGMGDPRMLAGGISEALITHRGAAWRSPFPRSSPTATCAARWSASSIEMEKIAVSFADSLGAEPQGARTDGGIARTA